MTGQPSPIEQWMLNMMAENPAPVLSTWEMAVGAIIMGVIVFVILSFVGEVLMHVSKRAGGCLMLLSLPAGGLFALVAFVIMVTG